MDKYCKGLEKIRSVLGEDAVNIVDDFNSISKDITGYLVEHGYADYYSREGLSDKLKTFAAVASLVSAGNTGLSLKAQMSGMLNVGWQKKDIEELLIFLIGFVGLAPVVDAMVVLGELSADI